MSGTVHVVLALDTEGPASDARHPDLLSTWNDIDRFVGKLCDPVYRAQVPDSYGNGLVISWFMLTWVGFKTNPAGRDFGYHKVFDHYTARWGTELRLFGDGHYWHYHQPARSGIGTEWTRDWSASTQYLDILNRLLIDRWYFPSVFRAGGAIESNEMSDWLERWIPIDYSSRAAALDWDSCAGTGIPIRELSDWSRAPSDWRPYHPSRDDYQASGTMRRVILRCVDLFTGLYALTEDDVEAAFTHAASGEDVVLAAFDHDYRDRADLFADRLMRTVGRVAPRHRSVTWRYASALDAAQATLGWESNSGPALTATADGADIAIHADRPLFGPTPYVACKDLDTDAYRQEQVIVTGERAWTVRLDTHPRPRIIGLAASDAFGNVGVAQYLWNDTGLTAVDREGIVARSHHR